MVNLKQNLLKTRQNTENIGDLDNKERFLYIYTYFSLGNNYNQLNLVIMKKVFQHPVHTSLPLLFTYHFTLSAATFTCHHF